MENPTRPVLHRLLHAFVEFVLACAFAGAVFVAFNFWVCSTWPYMCIDAKRLAFQIVGLILAIVAWGYYLSYCQRVRSRLTQRYRLDTAVAIATAVLWIYCYVLSR